VQYQRASSLQSLLMLTFFFFFFSGGNNSPLGDISGESDARGESNIPPTKVHYSLSLNSTSVGTQPDIERRRELPAVSQWLSVKLHSSKLPLPIRLDAVTNPRASVQPSPLSPSFSSLLPPHLLSPSELSGSHPSHDSIPRDSLLFYSNITGFYRKGKVSPLNLTHPNYPIWTSDEDSKPIRKGPLEKLDGFWQHLTSPPKHSGDKDHIPHIPTLINTTAFNATLAGEKRGTWDWNKVEGWELSVKEREIIVRDDDGEIVEKDNVVAKKGKKQRNSTSVDEWGDWAWVHVSSVLSALRSLVSFFMS
jgi:hypothetical protein